MLKRHRGACSTTANVISLQLSNKTCKKKKEKTACEGRHTGAAVEQGHELTSSATGIILKQSCTRRLKSP